MPPTASAANSVEPPVSRLRAALSGLPTLHPDTVEAVVRIAEIQTVEPGETLFEEGEEDNALFFILKGTLLLSRTALHSDLHLGDIPAGSTLGDLSFLDAATRQATAKAGDHTVIVARVDAATLILEPEGDRHYDSLRLALIVPVTRSFRDHSKQLVVALEERQRFSGFFIYMIAILYGCMLIYFLVAEQFVEDTTTNLFAWQSAAVLIVPSLFIVYRLGLSRADLGLQSNDFGSSFRGGLLWGFGVAVVLAGSFFLARVSGLLEGFERAQPFEPLDLILYLPHTFVQEFVARGIIQNGYQRFFDDRTGYRSVGFASLVFGVAHIPLGLFAVALTAFGGLLFGLFFLRYRNLVGVTIVHYALGGTAIVLGFI